MVVILTRGARPWKDLTVPNCRVIGCCRKWSTTRGDFACEPFGMHVTGHTQCNHLHHKERMAYGASWCPARNRTDKVVLSPTKGSKVVIAVMLTQDIAKALDTTDVKETAPDQDTLVMFIIGVEREAPFTRRPEV